MIRRAISPRLAINIRLYIAVVYITVVGAVPLGWELFARIDLKQRLSELDRLLAIDQYRYDLA